MPAAGGVESLDDLAALLFAGKDVVTDVPQDRFDAASFLDDGMDAGRLAGTDGAVFVGCSSKDYGTLQGARPESGNAYTISGMAGGDAANRISHLLDWDGQSVTVDRACSSALPHSYPTTQHPRLTARLRLSFRAY
ncbi:hypothetical protein SAZ_05170 [Streptomyces noursei ZPM]|uniref:Polyketide synthase n=1 Tax=Streptomyces noursei TaxID=1971 RepID=A0A401QUU4_STRNR|nr:beta-ketoacyl synthase N-terminal-like domain-containing protein [Streptomyces noursei]AKA08482.1 hypothetical protein SAZ_05170 [Streptomyces noursei ZPM]EOT05951.1 hypothetical protein K530_00900 [Streptomyces noursei CCRC 11814]EXU87968.1 hypothetical protein P354_32255 [Streptomyces noursei PD-1]UWS70366.1 hypothetical protein N1H47_03440 [Streptomyces noursei]GCB89072.1 polyketide synthase [Streptomyces noursei]